MRDADFTALRIGAAVFFPVRRTSVLSSQSGMPDRAADVVK
jgi:hypothetical protein